LDISKVGLLNVFFNVATTQLKSQVDNYILHIIVSKILVKLKVILPLLIVGGVIILI
jgi:hypothetical protein